MPRSNQLGRHERITKLTHGNRRHPRPHPANANQPDKLHKRIGTRAQIIRISARIQHQPLRRCPRIGHCGQQRFADIGRRQRGIGFHQFEEPRRHHAAILGQLAPRQIERLHPVCAFIQHGDPRIAHDLFHPPLGDIAVPAKHLLHRHRRLKPPVSAISLQHRGEELRHRIGGAAFARIFQRVRQINLQRRPQQQRAETFGKGARVHQHPPHIGMHQQRISRRARIGPLASTAPLPPVQRISSGALIGMFRMGQTLRAHTEPRRVHHDEHRS